MNDHMQEGMAEATRLTRAGRLAEATATIQRTLGRTPTTNKSNEGFSSAESPIDAEFHVIDDSRPSMETSEWRMAPRKGTPTRRSPVHPAAALSVLTPDALQLPGSLGGAGGHRRSFTSEVVPSSVYEGGQFVDGTYTNTAGTRAYKLYIPSGYTGQALPLVVMLHGCTQTPVDFANGTRMNVLAERGMFLVAYPEQETSANGSKCWNWFKVADQQRGAGEPSLIAEITQQIMRSYYVDASRVYVAGLSAGGAMAAILAATYPDLYTAVGVHSGLAYGSAHDLHSAFAAMKQGASQYKRQFARAMPTIIFHGDRDTTVATVNADIMLDQCLQVADGGSGTMRIHAQDATVQRGQATGGHTYTRFIYHDASGLVIVEKWIIHKAGHAWSGGNPGGSFTDPKGPDASAEMIRFFTQHAKR